MKRAETAEEIRESLRPIWDSGRFRLVVLFGSLAAEKMTPESDLDLAFLPKEGIPFPDETLLTADVIRTTHWNHVDVVDLRKADPVLAMQIATKGEPLFCEQPSDFTEFKSLAFRKFIDTEKLRRARRQVLDKFGRNHEPH